LIVAVLLEANDEWQLQHSYMQTEPMAELMPAFFLAGVSCLIAVAAIFALRDIRRALVPVAAK